MDIQRGDPRERMRSLTVEELRAVIRGRDGASSPDEVRAADEELTARFSPLHEGPSAQESGIDNEAMPFGMRVLFYLASAAAALQIVLLLFFLALFVTAHNAGVPALVAIVRFGIAATWCVSLARALRYEHRHGRRFVLSLLSLALVVKVSGTIMTGQLSYWDGGVIAVLALAFCYVAFSRAVDRYYSVPGALVPA